MRALRPTLLLDLRLQRRYGFWHATCLVVIIWIGVLWIVPDDLLGAAMPYLLITDLQFFMFFTAGALIFERGERTLFALLITPLRFGEYLAAKLLSMSALAFLTCAIVVLADYGLGFDPLALLTGVTAMTLLMVLAGFVTAPLFPSVSEWLMPSTLALALANLPLLDYSGLVPHWAFYLVPTEGVALLLGSAFHQVSLTGWQAAYAVLYPAAWIVLLCRTARWVFYKHLVTRQGRR